ncbi:putative mfs multidrug transporter protein [Botrytis fragariae]|uniref:Putative mfs multidrug transporter protein n=1 Tax=Botrytis fragariae TaxID=1964551 RepID=A0A8H6ELU0_9HELO|nr:putative mfs multidrug transporter protein [Botrytis fragariae]KAF5876660.1 putative mfs multidrug transporter protein [Botrytis fragariae]
MTELEYIKSSERIGRVGSVVELRTTSVSRYLHHNKAVSEGEYTSGWRLHLITLAWSHRSSVLPSTVSITNELKGFDEASWFFTSNILTYAGLVMIWAKLGDIFGRKNLILLWLLPTCTTISGPVTQVESLVAHLKTRQIFTRKLQVSVGFNSPQMMQVESEYLHLISTI